MSHTDIYVKASNGRFYRTPKIHGTVEGATAKGAKFTLGFFIRFDADGPRLILEKPEHNAAKFVNQAIMRSGLTAMVNGGRAKSDGYQTFKKVNRENMPSLAYEIKVWRAPDPEIITEHLGEYAGNEIPAGAQLYLFEQGREKVKR